MTDGYDRGVGARCGMAPGWGGAANPSRLGHFLVENMPYLVSGHWPDPLDSSTTTDSLYSRLAGSKLSYDQHRHHHPISDDATI